MISPVSVFLVFIILVILWSIFGESTIRIVKSYLTWNRCRKDRVREQTIAAIRHEKEKLEAELHLARQRKELEDFRKQDVARLKLLQEKTEAELQLKRKQRELDEFINPPAERKRQGPTPEEVRAQKRVFWEGEIIRLRKTKHESVEVLSAGNEEERQRIANMYEDAIDDAREQLRKYL